MKTLAYLLFVVGVVVASSFASRHVPVPPSADGAAPTAGARIRVWGTAAGAPFAGGLVLMLLSGLWARRLARAEVQASRGAAGADDPEVILTRMAEALDDLPAVEADQGAAVAVLDELLEADVPAFLEHRERLIAAMGLSSFAMMIGEFAQAERNIGRAWSAITDGALDEVPACVERAKTGLSGARAALQRPA